MSEKGQRTESMTEEYLDDSEMLELFRTLEKELSEITVSEELIQRTLVAAEAGTPENKEYAAEEMQPADVIELAEQSSQPRVKNKKKKQWAWLYTMAAAAVLVLVYVGSGIGRKAAESNDAATSEGSAKPAYSYEAMAGVESATGNGWQSDESEESEESTTTQAPEASTEDGEINSADSSAMTNEEAVTESNLVENSGAADAQAPMEEGESTEDMAESEPASSKETDVREQLQEALILCGYPGEVVNVQRESQDASAGEFSWRVWGELPDGGIVECLLYTEKRVEIWVLEADGAKTLYSLSSERAKQIWDCLVQ